MKIVFTIDSLLQGGTEQSLLHLIPLMRPDIEPLLVYFYEKHDLRKAYQSAGIPTRCLNIKSSYGFPNAIRRLIKLLQIEKPDLVISTLYRANIISRISCFKLGLPLVGSFVEDSYGENRKADFKGFSRLKFWFPWLLDRFTASVPFAYISNSKSIAEANSRMLGLSQNKIFTVYRGRNSQSIMAWQPVDIKDVPFRFLAIGRLFDKKGFIDLLESIHLINKNNYSFQVTIVGEGPQRNLLEQYINQNKLNAIVSLSGKQHNAWEQLYTAHAFVFPSWYEGFSGALVEAMMVGLPIIASDIPMNLEAVTHNKTARVFPVKNAKALAAEMEWVMENYEAAKTLGTAARIEAMKRFDVKKIAAEYKAVLQKLVAEHVSK